MPSRAQICNLCDQYLQAVSAGNLKAIMALFADNPTIEDPIGSEPCRGRDAAQAFYERNKGVELLLSRLGPVTVVGSNAAFQFRVEATASNDKRVMTSTDVMSFDDDGRIRSLLAFPDAEARPDAL